jgi:glycosyltransferase involved in cell wall biosynthesis
LKLLIYTEYFLPVIGGVQTAVEVLARSLATPSGGGSTADAAIEVKLVTRSKANGMNDSIAPYRVIRQPSFVQLVRLIQEADVIHVAGPCLIPLILGWFFRKLIVVEHHGYQAACPNGLLLFEPQKTPCPGYFMRKQHSKCLKCNSHNVGWIRSFALLLLTFPRRWLCQRIAVNVSITNHVGIRLALPRTRTIYYGINPVQPRQHRNPSPAGEKLRIVFLGRLVAEKGVSILLQSARLLYSGGYQFQLTLIGEGPERESLETLAKGLGIYDCVTFAGEMQRADVDRTLLSTDLVVMPSLWEETTGLAAVEQMMSGGVVIVADIGGLAEVVGDAGLKFPSGNVEALYSCIREIIDDGESIRRFGSAARERALTLFSADRYVREHALMYRELRERLKRN